MAADYAKMIVAKWTASGESSFDLAAAFSWEIVKILADNGMCIEEIAHTFEALADQVRHDARNVSICTRRH